MKSIRELTDEELEKRIQEFDYDLPNELLRRFKIIKEDLNETKIQLDRAIKELDISERKNFFHKEILKEINEAYLEKIGELIEAESRLAYYEGDDE